MDSAWMRAAPARDCVGERVRPPGRAGVRLRDVQVRPEADPDRPVMSYPQRGRLGALTASASTARTALPPALALVPWSGLLTRPRVDAVLTAN